MLLFLTICFWPPPSLTFVKKSFHFSFWTWGLPPPPPTWTMSTNILVFFWRYLFWFLSTKFVSNFKSAESCIRCEPLASIPGFLKCHEFLRDIFNTVTFLWTLFVNLTYKYSGWFMDKSVPEQDGTTLQWFKRQLDTGIRLTSLACL